SNWLGFVPIKAPRKFSEPAISDIPKKLDRIYIESGSPNISANNAIINPSSIPADFHSGFFL
ncbi:MAG: hypothetical protein KAJ51_13415, partial [Thermoplasmata archaeon]|nr:hypothetical protein [Thermoplasmata archaeon]